MARWNSWTFITAANMCGIWDVLYTGNSNRRSPNGLNHCATNCDTVRNNEPCARLLSSRNDAVNLAR